MTATTEPLTQLARVLSVRMDAPPPSDTPALALLEAAATRIAAERRAKQEIRRLAQHIRALQTIEGRHADA